MLNKVHREFLLKLREMPEFQQVMDALEEDRPVVPRWSPSSGVEAELLMENLKFQTGQQRGFDKLYSALTGKALSNG